MEQLDELGRWIFEIALPEFSTLAGLVVQEATGTPFFTFAAFAISISIGVFGRSIAIFLSAIIFVVLSLSLHSYLVPPTLRDGLIWMVLTGLVLMMTGYFSLKRKIGQQRRQIEHLVVEADATKKLMHREIEWRRAGKDQDIDTNKNHYL